MTASLDAHHNSMMKNRLMLRETSKLVLYQHSWLAMWASTVLCHKIIPVSFSEVAEMLIESCQSSKSGDELPKTDKDLASRDVCIGSRSDPCNKDQHCHD
jgi:hypothetical protein